MRLRTKLTALIISAGLCFSLVADAKTVKIPKWIFGFTFGASVAVHRAQCKALKGTWNYENSDEYHHNCDKPQAGPGPECAKSCNRVWAERGGPVLGNEYYTLNFMHHMWGIEDRSCYNNWLDWAHATFGEPYIYDDGPCGERDFTWSTYQCNDTGTCTSNSITISRACYINGFMVKFLRVTSKTPESTLND